MRTLAVQLRLRARSAHFDEARPGARTFFSLFPLKPLRMPHLLVRVCGLDPNDADLDPSVVLSRADLARADLDADDRAEALRRLDACVGDEYVMGTLDRRRLRDLATIDARTSDQP